MFGTGGKKTDRWQLQPDPARGAVYIVDAGRKGKIEIAFFGARRKRRARVLAAAMNKGVFK